ncbi:phage antirepressor KilAC domain-containing protein [Marinobacterium litorale]|uniref:phage antirepressor KilAC domain-containing protein n=1 Tax=Marinobacterium litorale TaxID=404770 RepID=UPI000559DA47|nr:phage antirepressor KilAC domain-containing protein [Marinobacterium litorale]
MITNGDHLTMSSREVAELVEKRHDNVKRTMESLSEKGLIAFTQTEEKATGGRPGTVYLVGKRDSYVVVAQLSPEFTARLVDRWQELEQQAQTHAAIDFNDPAKLRGYLLQATEEIEKRDQKILYLAPKAEALDRIATADGSLCITNAAKDLQVRPKDLFNFLSHRKWIYKRTGSSSWTAYQDKIQQGLLEHKTTEVTRSDGSNKVTEQVRVTPKGLTKLARLVAEGEVA